MIKPILACENPYTSAKEFEMAGWNIDFSQPPESGDPLVGISLFDNVILLGVTNGYVEDDKIPYIGCGVELYINIPKSEMKEVYNKHNKYVIEALQIQPWGDMAFKVEICGFKLMISAGDINGY